MSHVEIVPWSGCWIWMGWLDAGGYGRFWIDGKIVKAHRAARIVFGFLMPEGTEADHLCRTRCCVNPRHTEPVTHLENVRRGNAGKHLSSRTHCPQGHPYDLTNTQIRKSGARRCRTCSNYARTRLRALRNFGSVNS